MLALLFGVNLAQAQNYVPLSFSAGWKVHTKPSQLKVIGEPGAMQFIRLGAGMAYPISLERGRFVAGLRYDHLVYQFEDWPETLEPPHVMHHARMELIGIRQFEDGFEGTIFLAPGFATAFSESISSQDLNLSLGVLLAKIYPNRFKFGMGVSYITDRIPALLPLMQLNWEGESGVTVNALLPSSFQAWFSNFAELFRWNILSGCDRTFLHGKYGQPILCRFSQAIVDSGAGFAIFDYTIHISSTGSRHYNTASASASGNRRRIRKSTIIGRFSYGVG